MTPGIAIVGMACRYPDARTPEELWENALAQRRAFRRLPRERLSLDDYFAPDPEAPDRTYVSEAALIEGWEFDRVRFRVAGATLRAADLTHWLALEVADLALRDAGFPERELPRESTCVLVGNTLTGEFSRAATLRLRWPYVRRTVDAQLEAEGFDAPRRTAFLAALEISFKAPFAPVDEETLAGGLSNTIAGRICNQYHLGGGGYTVDGACSSSLLAVAHACEALESGQADAALAGGVDLSLDPFELVGFAKAGALARDDMRVYDRDASGFLPGEGCGFVVLMRADDAVARGLRPYALIRGVGLSSDGAGAIARPEAAGQRLALARAYRRAGYGPDSVGYFEGHGTGTPLGDDVELRALALEREAAGTCEPPAAVGSIKANIGHTKAAAGVAGLIKAALALHHQVLPPVTGLRVPRASLAAPRSPLRVLLEPQVWPAERPLRAGVSSFGFGGINVHVTLDSPAEVRRAALSAREERLARSAQDAEVVFLAGADGADLARQAEELKRRAAGLSRAELGDLGAALLARLGAGHVRAALVVASAAQLDAALGRLLGWLDEARAHGQPVARFDLEAGLALGFGARAPRIGFLFPGQASPVRARAGAWERRFAPVRATYARAALVGEGADTEHAQPAIVAAELSGLRLLRALGIEAALALGHSLGELVALHWAEALGEDELLELVAHRARLMAAAPGDGAMASLACAAAEAEALSAGACVA